MPIEGFDYKAFAANLSQQAGGVIPADIPPQDKEYIVKLVHAFCNMSGEAISNDTSFPFTAENAYIITQFIGEWTFHKSIDLIKSRIPNQYRDKILQAVAFTVFEVAKQCVKKEVPQQEMIQIVEAQVKNAFTTQLEELKNKGALSEDLADKAAHQSNLDDMAKKQPGGAMSDTKLLKLVSFAMILKNMPKDRIETILQKFDKDAQEVLIQYLKMENLENKLDKSLASKYLNEMKMQMPISRKPTIPKVSKRMHELMMDADRKYVSRVIEAERPYIKEFIFHNTEDEIKLPPKIADIVCQHLEEILR